MSNPAAARERRVSPRVLRGDEEQLYREHAERLRRIVRARVRLTEDQLDDACARAWLILLRAQPRRATAFPWLVVVAEREAWRVVAEDADQAPLDAPSAADGEARIERVAALGDPLAVIEARERLRAVAAALSERQRRLVALQALGYRYAEIGALTGDSLRTVDRQLRRAGKRLRPRRAA